MNQGQKKRSSTRARPATGSKRSCPETPTLVKKKVGGYLIGDTVGQGSFAKVRSGTHILTQERVAIKIIDKKLIAKREYVRRNLRREAVVLQKLRHPNIAQLYEVMETSNNYYLVLEFADGGEFMRYLCEKRKLSERECRKYIRQLVSAVDHMHKADIIHRDIKVENFLLDEDLNLKVIDFGLSNILGPDDLLSTQCGSPAYAAPEIFCNSSYGPAVDVWSIGVNMYAMLTGELPFVVDPPNNMTKLHARILQGCTIPVHLTKDCQDLLSKMLTINEKQRIKLSNIMKHSWVNRGYSHHLKSHIHPDYVQKSIEIDDSILSSMADCAGYSQDDVKEIVLVNKPLSENALYHLMIKRLAKGWGYPDSHTTPNSCNESTFDYQSPRADSVKDSPPLPATSPPALKVIRPLSGKVRQLERNGKGNVSEMNRRNDQARRLKSPIVCEDYQGSNMGTSTLSATVNIVRSPSKESIFEDIKRTLDKSMVNLDINNNHGIDNDISMQDDVTMSDIPEPPRDLDSRLSIYSQNPKNKKVTSIVCNTNGKTGNNNNNMLSAVYLQVKPAADEKYNKDGERVNSPSKGNRLFHRRTDKERKQGLVSSKSGCIVIVNGKLANSGDIDAARPRALSRAEIPERVGSSLRNRMPNSQVPPPIRMQRNEMQQRPHTEGSVDIGRSNNLPMGMDPSHYTGRGFPQHQLGFYYSTSGRHARSTTYTAMSPKCAQPVPSGRPNGRYRGPRHQRSVTAPTPSRYYNGTLPTPQRHLATAPGGHRNHGNHNRTTKNLQKPFSNRGLPSIFISSFNNM